VAEPDTAKVVAELRKQGWQCDLTNDATKWKAKSPDASKGVVVFPKRPNDIVYIVRELRAKGFIWPPTANGHAPDERARITSTPFPPKPHPEVRTLSLVESEKAAPAFVAAPKPKDEGDEGLAFIALRDAKEYEKLAAGEYAAAKKEAEMAKSKEDAARRAWDEACGALKAAKAKFDAAFGATEVGA